METIQETAKMEVIASWVWDPRAPSIFGKNKKSDLALYHEVSCGNKENCSLFKNKQCALLNVAVLKASPKCPYGSRTRQSSPSQRAHGFHTWVSSRKEKSVDMGIGRTGDRMAVVGEFIFLPYPYLDLCKEIPLDREFMRLDAFPKFIGTIFAHRPTPMFGGGFIEDYPRKVLPRIAQHISEEFPELVEANPVIREYLPKSNVGRLAYVYTLKPGTPVVCKTHKTKWTWDGEFLVSDSFKPHFIPVKALECHTRLKPEPGETITIHSDSQTDSDTRYKD